MTFDPYLTPYFILYLKLLVEGNSIGPGGLKIVTFGQNIGINTFRELIGENEILPLFDHLFEVSGRRKPDSLIRGSPL